MKVGEEGEGIHNKVAECKEKILTLCIIPLNTGGE